MEFRNGHLQNSSKERALLWLVISLLGHLCLFLIFALMPPFEDFMKGLQANKKPLEIKTIPESQLDDLKIVGVKESDKKYFNVPLGEKVNPQRISPPSLTDLGKVQPDKNLRPKKTAQKVKSKAESEEKIEKKGRTLVNLKKAEEMQDVAKKKIMMSPYVDRDFARALSRADFNIHIDPPKGVTEDELNEIEEVFFSFQKRVFTTYLGSFLKNLNDFRYSKPYFNIFDHLNTGTLTGRVTFDVDGNIKAIKMFRWSNDEGVQELFMNTLKGIEALPNPPKAFVKNQEDFSIYYSLIL